MKRMEYLYFKNNRSVLAHLDWRNRSKLGKVTNEKRIKTNWLESSGEISYLRDKYLFFKKKNHYFRTGIKWDEPI